MINCKGCFWLRSSSLEGFKSHLITFQQVPFGESTWSTLPFWTSPFACRDLDPAPGTRPSSITALPYIPSGIAPCGSPSAKCLRWPDAEKSPLLGEIDTGDCARPTWARGQSHDFESKPVSNLSPWGLANLRSFQSVWNLEDAHCIGIQWVIEMQMNGWVCQEVPRCWSLGLLMDHFPVSLATGQVESHAWPKLELLLVHAEWLRYETSHFYSWSFYAPLSLALWGLIGYTWLWGCS